MEIRGQRSGLGATSASALRQEHAGTVKPLNYFSFLAFPSFYQFFAVVVPVGD